MSRKKQNERWKILYTHTSFLRWMGVEVRGTPVITYKYNVAEFIKAGINDYIYHAGFHTIEEAKAYRRKKIQEERGK
jgi:hypothetical protein